MSINLYMWQLITNECFIFSWSLWSYLKCWNTCQEQDQLSYTNYSFRQSYTLWFISMRLEKLLAQSRCTAEQGNCLSYMYLSILMYYFPFVWKGFVQPLSNRNTFDLDGMLSDGSIHAYLPLNYNHGVFVTTI